MAAIVVLLRRNEAAAHGGPAVRLSEAVAQAVDEQDRPAY
jgi:hypothetical protein